METTDTSVSTSVENNKSLEEQATDLKNLINIEHQLHVYDEDRRALKNKLDPLFQEVWHEALVCLESLLPDHKKPGTSDFKLFNALKRRVLHVGNNSQREAAKVLGNFAIREVLRSEQVTRIIVKGRGPHNLPPGVKMPGE